MASALRMKDDAPACALVPMSAVTMLTMMMTSAIMLMWMSLSVFR